MLQTIETLVFIGAVVSAHPVALSRKMACDLNHARVLLLENYYNQKLALTRGFDFINARWRVIL